MTTLKMCLFLERERDLRPRGWSWVALGTSVGGLGCSWAPCWRSWVALGAYVRGPGPSWGLCWRFRAVLGPLFGAMLAVLGRSWDLCWWSWPLLGPLLAVLGRFGPENVEEHGNLENVLISRAGARSAAWGSVLSRSWDLCWRSWAAFVPYVVGLGPLLDLCWRSGAALGPMLAVFGSLQDLSGRSWDAFGPK